MSEYVRTIEEAINKWEEVPIGKSHNKKGEKINKWTLLYRTKDSTRPMWVAQCECGNIGKIRGGKAIKLQCTNCQALNNQRNYTGLRFNLLTCLNEREVRNKKTYIKCKCDCGNEIWVWTGNLTSGGVKSCGCLNHTYHAAPLQDLTGKIFNDLTVIKYYNTLNGERYWQCQCKCGTIKNISTRNLTTGRAKSCGCRKYSDIKPGDLFGELTVIKSTEKRSSNGSIIYLCQCSCGNTCEVPSRNLIKGDWKSCGCNKNKSYGEININKILTNNNISFISQKTFDDLKAEKGRKFKFDFYVNNQYIIEYDGSQHFKYTGTGWDTKEHFERTRKSDLLKNKYCFEHNIPLIRIPCNKEYTLEDLKLETTRFLLTPKNEKLYYENNK